MTPNTYPFKNFYLVATTGYLQRAFQWVLEDRFTDTAPFTFELQASETSDFSSIAYTISAGSNYYALDNTKKLQSNIPALMYRVKLTTGSDRVFYSGILHYFDLPENAYHYQKAKEIVRKENVRFKYTGQNGWILKRKNYGEASANNLDPISKVPLSDRLLDYGTGKAGGYHTPVAIKYSREGKKIQTTLSPQGFGTVNQEAMRIRMTGFPLVTPYDILVTDNGPRYLFDEVNPTLMPGTDVVVVQSCEVNLIPFTDPLYKITIS